jgi:RND family efflux transporter MFP subunit
MAEPIRTEQADLHRLRIERDDDDGRLRPLRWGVALVLLAGLAWGGWEAWRRWLKPAPAVKVARVTSPAAAAATGGRLDASGYLVPQKRAEVATKQAGVVDMVFVDEGTPVEENQPLAVLKSAAEKAMVDEAIALESEAAASRDESKKLLTEAQVTRDEMKREYERRKPLRERQVIAEDELTRAEMDWKASESRVAAAEERVKTAETRMKVAETRRRQAEIRVDELTIRSPIKGVVVSRKIQPGEAASPAGIVTGTRGGALFTVADFSTLEAEVDVNEVRLAELRPGQACRVAVDAFPKKKYSGELRQITPMADRQRAVVKIKVRLLDPDGALLPDMAVRVTFLAEGEKVVAAGEGEKPRMPEKAVYRMDGKAYAWVVADGHARRRAIEVGAPKDGVVEVKSGLSGGESVVIENAEPMKDGMRVRTEE